MASVINTNISSLTAQRNLGMSQTSLATSMQRLSSGLRINSAKDDAAGMSISERMTAQIRGSNQAARNANDGISLAQTAEGALNEVTSNLQRIRELAVQSANSTNSASDRASLQAEVTQLSAEITRVASQTKFNGIAVLDGTFTTKSFQVGADANQTIDITEIADARATALGSESLGTSGTAMGKVVVGAVASLTSGVAAETDLTIKTSAGTSTAIAYAINTTGSSASLETTGGAREIAAAINSAAGTLGVTATASNSTSLSTLSAAGTVTFTLNSQAVTATISDKNDLSSLVSAINGVQGTSGVTANFTSPTSKSSITLSTSDGRNIVLTTFANAGATTGTMKIGDQTLTEGGSVDAIATGSVALSSNEGRITAANANTDVFASATSNSSFTSVAALDVSTAAGAQAAIGALDSALSQVNSSRGSLGAYQNRFSSAIASLQTTAENVSASRSRIQDADFAMETANLSRAQILQQAGTAMVAQANQLPQGVLTLLQ